MQHAQSERQQRHDGVRINEELKQLAANRAEGGQQQDEHRNERQESVQITLDA